LKHNVWLVRQYNVSCIALNHTSPKGLAIASRCDIPKTQGIWWEYGFKLCGNRIETIVINHLLNLLSGNNLESVWNTF
jgi:hypothetical protein